MGRGTKVLGALLLCVTLAAGACKSGKGVKVGAKHDIGDKSAFFLEAADETTSGKTIQIPDVVLKDTKGYVAIHSDANGAPGPVIGVSDLLSAGETQDVHVKLTKKMTASADVWPMIHVEDNNDAKYDFPPNDAPAKTSSGSVVVIKVHIKVR